jgi:hypothetical protein
MNNHRPSDILARGLPLSPAPLEARPQVLPLELRVLAQKRKEP